MIRKELSKWHQVDRKSAKSNQSKNRRLVDEVDQQNSQVDRFVRLNRLRGLTKRQSFAWQHVFLNTRLGGLARRATFACGEKNWVKKKKYIKPQVVYI